MIQVALPMEPPSIPVGPASILIDREINEHWTLGTAQTNDKST